MWRTIKSFAKAKSIRTLQMHAHKDDPRSRCTPARAGTWREREYSWESRWRRIRHMPPPLTPELHVWPHPLRPPRPDIPVLRPIIFAYMAHF